MFFYLLSTYTVQQPCSCSCDQHNWWPERAVPARAVRTTMLEQSERVILRWPLELVVCFQPFWPPETYIGPRLTNHRNVCQQDHVDDSRSCLPTVCFVHWAFKFHLEIQLGVNTDNDTGRVNVSLLEVYFSHRKGSCEINTYDVVLQCSSCLCCFEYSIYQAWQLKRSIFWNLSDHQGSLLLFA